ncbi:MAG: response regulator [Candidatus Sulfotelmatobacter sp.]
MHFYVDENPKSRRLLTCILRRSGFDVIEANNPIEAIELCGQITFDIALLDYQMQKMRGSELAQEIKFLLPDVPIVLISGKAALPLADLAFVDAHFGLGTDLDELVDRLRIPVQPKPALAMEKSRSIAPLGRLDLIPLTCLFERTQMDAGWEWQTLDVGAEMVCPIPKRSARSRVPLFWPRP